MDWKQGFKLGEWTVHPETGIFIKDGMKRHAEPKLVDVLLVLINHQGNVVSRDVLLTEAWQDLVVSDEVLTRCISELRTLLGDTSRERHYIRTVPRRGYVLVAKAEPLDNSECALTSSSRPSQPLSSETVESKTQPLNKIPSSTPTDSVQENSAPWPAKLITDFIGLLQAMISALVKVFKYSFVTVMLIVFMVLVYAGLNRDPDRPFASVQVGMEETIEAGGDSTNEEAFLEVVDLAIDVGQQIQQELGRKIAIQKGTLEPGEEQFEGTGSYEAYEQYLLGRNFWRVRTESSLAKAASYFKRAVELDKNYAQAWAGLADTQVLQTFYGYGDRERLLAEADQSSAQAVKLAPELAEAHGARGVYLSESGHLDEAVAALKMAVRLKPDFSMAHMWLGNAYLDQGVARKAFEAYEQAYQLDPLHESVRLNYLSGLALIGRTEQARLLADRFAAESDTFAMLPIKQAMAAGYFDRALDRITLLQDQKNDQDGLEVKALHSLIYLDQVDAVAALIQRQENRDPWEKLWLESMVSLKERDAERLKKSLKAFNQTEISNEWCKGYRYDLLVSREHWLSGNWLQTERGFARALQSHPERCQSDPESVIISHLYQARAIEKIGDNTTRRQYLNQARAMIESSWEKGWRSPGFMVAALSWALIDEQDDKAREYLDFMKESGVQPWGMLAIMPLLDDYLDAEVLKPYKGRLQLHYIQQQERAANLSSQLLKTMLSADREKPEGLRAGRSEGLKA
ncbi:MAG: winged helix-turn-helix domain-containing protein [Endozoicomonas sp.]|uniref:transcriptional regulator n=1 Tax=Endozoicomonas sp. TaxID=1892382 RepID=UPI003D9BCCF2